MNLWVSQPRIGVACWLQITGQRSIGYDWTVSWCLGAQPIQGRHCSCCQHWDVSSLRFSKKFSSRLYSYYKSLSFYLQEQPNLLTDLLSVLIPRIDHSRVVRMFAQIDHIPLIRPYLIAVQHVSRSFNIGLSFILIYFCVAEHRSGQWCLQRFIDRGRGLQDITWFNWQFRQLQQHQVGSATREARTARIPAPCCPSVQEEQEMGRVDHTFQTGQALQGRTDHCSDFRLDGGCGRSSGLFRRYREQRVFCSDALLRFRFVERRYCWGIIVAARLKRFLHAIQNSGVSYVAWQGMSDVEGCLNVFTDCYLLLDCCTWKEGRGPGCEGYEERATRGWGSYPWSWLWGTVTPYAGQWVSTHSLFFLGELLSLNSTQCSSAGSSRYAKRYWHATNELGHTSCE